jgi:phospholipase C
MPRPLPRWLFVLIGVIIIVVVGSVVLVAINVSKQKGVNAAVSTIFTTASNKTVFLILMENHNWSDIKNSPSAPYINKTLLPMASYAEQYYNPPGNHPSEPNYLWLEAGTNFGISDDTDPYANHQSTTQHLVTLLNNAHISWKSYQESISGTVCPLTGNGLYAPKHNPMVFFDDVTNSNDPNALYCIAHVRPYTELATDLQKNTQASYNFITPNLCDDMHDTCAPLNDSVKQGDSWLAQNLPAILSSQAYKNGGIVLITWDEGEGGDGPIGMIVLSHNAKGGGYSNTIRYTHSSTLRTLEEIFGVSPLLGDAAHATDLRDLFKRFP